MSNLIASDVQGQVVDSPVLTLFDIELPDGTFLYIHPGLDDDLTNIQFRDYTNNSQINTYVPFPVIIDGLEQGADGAIKRPSLSVANIGNSFKSALGGFVNKDLVGQRITRRQTLKKYLYGESPDLSNPPKEFNRVTYTVDRISGETNTIITFELTAIHDLEGVVLPRRTMVGKYCSWQYQGVETFGKGGCVWPANSLVYDNDSTAADGDAPTKFYNPFFDVDDKILAHATLLSNNSNSWDPSANYTIGQYVEHGSRYFVAKFNNTGKNPITDTNDFWTEARAYTHWASGTSYSVGDLVRYKFTMPNNNDVDTIWMAIAAHTSGNANTPNFDSKVWRKEELCSKTLDGCKCRFGAIFKLNSTINNQIEGLTTGQKARGRTLPFGSFPGVYKFR